MISFLFFLYIVAKVIAGMEGVGEADEERRATETGGGGEGSGGGERRRKRRGRMNDEEDVPCRREEGMILV